MPLLLSGLTALAFGSGDFTGAFASRRSPALSVVVTSQVVGLALLGIVAPFTADLPGGVDLAWGAAAGLTGGIGLVLLYHGLATTRMSVTAPIGAVTGAVTPVAFGLLIGDELSTLAAGGIGAGLVAIVLVTMRPGGDAGQGAPATRSIVFGLAFGVAFGLFNVLISRTGSETGMWPLVAARLTSLGSLSVVAMVLRRPVVATGVVALSTLAGVLDALGNVTLLLALRIELIALVSVITSLYPVVTIYLARVVLGERIGKTQLAGIGLAVAAVGLIAAG